jgi:hypothetical protein
MRTVGSPNIRRARTLGAQHFDRENRALAEGSGDVNVVRNGNFDTDTIWGKGAGWAITDGKAVATPGVLSNLAQDIAPGGGAIGQTYRTTYTISGYTVGAMALYPGIGGGANPQASNGTFTASLTMLGDSTIYFQKDDLFDGSIDNVSMYLI